MCFYYCHIMGLVLLMIVVWCILYSTMWQGTAICVRATVCMCVCARTHTYTVCGVLDVHPGVRTGHVESLGRIQMYWSASIQCMLYMCTNLQHICICTCWSPRKQQQRKFSQNSSICYSIPPLLALPFLLFLLSGEDKRTISRLYKFINMLLNSWIDSFINSLIH